MIIQPADKTTLLLFSFALVIWNGPVTTNAQELDDVLSGFDSEPAVQQPANEELDELFSGFDEPVKEKQQAENTDSEILPDWMDVNGSFGLASSYNFAHKTPEAGDADFRDLSMLRSTITLNSKMRFGEWQFYISGHGFYDASYSIQGREQYSNALLDLYEDELEFDDLYIMGSLNSSLDVKIGRQVVVWGKSDNVRVTDILNPLDNRLPGMVDIKNRRLPVTMTKLDYYTGDWNLSSIIINEVRFSKNPVYNSDFFPGSSPMPPEESPDISLENQQYALALNGIFSGWDLSLYAAYVFDERAHIVQKVGSAQREHSRVLMTGLTSNIAFGNWLLKGEAAWFDGLEYSNLPDKDFSRLDYMGGIEYTGFSETLLSLELVNRSILNFDNQLTLSPDIAQENAMQTVAKLVRDFANDTIQLKILLSIFGAHGEDGMFERFQLDYAFTDAIRLIGGVIFYQAADQGSLSTISDNDRLFAELVYEF